jgi:phage terminase large subunit-like protein
VTAPLYRTPVPEADVARGDGEAVCEAIEALCTTTKDTFGAPAGEPMVLRPWQHSLVGDLYARRPDGRLRHRVELVGVPRKAGKSGLGAALGLERLIFGGTGAEVYSCAADKEQARIVFGIARAMAEASEDVSELVNVYKDALEVPATGSVYRCLSSEAFTKEGLNPSFVVFDEVHAQPNRELWDVMSLAIGGRRDPLLLGITTAGVRTDSTGADSLCFELYQYGLRVQSGEEQDATFYLCWYGAPDEADHRDPEVWRAANPSFGDLVDPEDFESAVRRTPEGEFRTKRLNQWVSSAETWFPAGVFEARALEREIDRRTPVVLGFDGSRSGDSTALVAVTMEETPHVWVIDCWEKPPGSHTDWRVPRGEVMATLRQTCAELEVKSVAADAYLWVADLEDLAAEGLPIVQVMQTPSRMVPATQRFYERVTTGTLTHSGDPRLVRHVQNATLRRTQAGAQLSKESKWSERRIDLAVAAVMALDEAAHVPPQKPRARFIVLDDLPDVNDARWDTATDLDDLRHERW